MNRRDLPDLLSHLVDRSLVGYDDNAHRYRMIESVRDYARELAEESGEATKEMHRFLQHILAFVENLKPGLEGQTPLEAHKKVAQELDNVRAAMDWALNTPGLESLALRIAADLGRYWIGAGRIQEGLRWYGKVIECATDPDPRDLAWAMLYQCRCKYMSGDRSETDELIDSTIKQMESIDDTHGRCIAISTKAWRYVADERTFDYGKELLRSAVKIAKEKDSPEYGAAGLIGLGECARLEGDLRLAEQLNLEAVPGVRIIDVAQLPIPLLNLGSIYLELGEFDRAVEYYKEAIDAALPYNDTYVAWAIQGIGMTLVKKGDFEIGGRILGYASSVLVEAERVDEETDYRLIKRVYAEATEAGGETFQQALAAGRAMTQKEALQLVSSETPPLDSGGGQ